MDTMTTRRALPCSLILLALAPACHGAAPAAAPSNAPGATAAPAAPWPSFWDTHHRGGDRWCTAADYQPAAARADEPAAARAEAWAAVADRCWFEWQGEERAIDAAGLAAFVGFGGALLELGFPHDCEDLMAQVTTPYPGGLSDVEVTEELQPLVDDALALGERCAAAAEAQLAAFVPPTCPGDACFALVEGEAPADDGAAAADDPDAEMMEDVVCPEVELRTTSGARRLGATEGALVGGFCCGVSAISTAVIGGQRYVRVLPSGEDSMFIRDCLGGTASATPTSVYRVDGDRLVLAADRTLVWH